jgi:hypothetical protein
MKTLIASATVCAAVLSLSVCSPAAAKIIVDLTGNNTTADASGNGNNGTWNGTPSYAPIGGTTGFNLDGTNNVYVPKQLFIEYTGEFDRDGVGPSRSH